jgi:hypothetical protein
MGVDVHVIVKGADFEKAVNIYTRKILSDIGAASLHKVRPYSTIPHTHMNTHEAANPQAWLQDIAVWAAASGSPFCVYSVPSLY